MDKSELLHGSSSENIDRSDLNPLNLKRNAKNEIKKNNSNFFGKLSAVANNAKKAITQLKSNKYSNIPKSCAVNTKDDLNEEELNFVERIGLITRDEEFKDILDRFKELSEESSNNDLNISTIKIERFVIHMIKRDKDPSWADAAFRAFDSNSDGEISFFEFLMADISLNNNKYYTENSCWLELRRRVIFFIYDRSLSGMLSVSDLFDLLEDMSTTEKNPEEFGIFNKLWIQRQIENKKFIYDEFNLETLSQELAKTKMELASSNFELEELQLKYIKLEKDMCKLKLDKAQVQTELDTFRSLPRDVRKIELNGMEETLFIDETYSIDNRNDEAKELMDREPKSSASTASTTILSYNLPGVTFEKSNLGNKYMGCDSIVNNVNTFITKITPYYEKAYTDECEISSK